MREVQRTTLVSNGNAKPSMTIFDALPIPVHPTTTNIPTFKGEATNRDAKELVVRRTIFSSDLCRISRHQIFVRVFVQHLRVSTTEARVTSWKACRKNGLDNSSVAQRPEHRQEHLLFDNTKKRRDLDVQGWTHQRCLAPESCSHIAIQSRTEEFRRCRSQAIHALQHLAHHAVSTRSNWGSELNVSSLHRIVSSLLLRSKLRAMGDKISKNLCHPSINATHHATEIPLSMNNITKQCGRSVHITGCRSTSDNS